MNNYQFDIMERCDFMPLTAELASLPTSPVYTRLMFLDLLHTQILEYPNVIK